MKFTRWKSIGILMLIASAIIGTVYTVTAKNSEESPSIWQQRDFYSVAYHYLNATEPPLRNSLEFKMLTAMMLLTGDNVRAEELIKEYQPKDNDDFVQGQFFVFLIDTILAYDPSAAETAESLLLRHPYPYLISSQLSNIAKSYLDINQPEPLFAWLNGQHGQLSTADSAELILQLISWYGEKGDIARAEKLFNDAEEMPAQPKLHFALALAESVLSTHPEVAVNYANQALVLLPLAKDKLSDVQKKNRMFRIASIFAETGHLDAARAIMNQDIQPYLETNIIAHTPQSQKELLLYKQLNNQQQIEQLLVLAADDFQANLEQSAEHPVYLAKDYAQLLAIFDQTATINELIDSVWFDELYACNDDFSCAANKATILNFQKNPALVATKLNQLVDGMPQDDDHYLAIINALADQNMCPEAEHVVRLLHSRLKSRLILDTPERKIMLCYLGQQQYEQAIASTELYNNDRERKETDLLIIIRNAVNRGDLDLVERLKPDIVSDEPIMILYSILLNRYASRRQVEEFYQMERKMLSLIKQHRENGETIPYSPYAMSALGYLHAKYHLPVNPEQQVFIDYLLDNAPPASETLTKEIFW